MITGFLANLVSGGYITYKNYKKKRLSLHIPQKIVETYGLKVGDVVNVSIEKTEVNIEAKRKFREKKDAITKVIKEVYHERIS